jgi:DNA ligase-1
MSDTLTQLPTLYKFDTKGKLREWTMVIEENSFHAVKGLVGGKLTEDKPRSCEAKNVGRSNETSPEQQADNEAKAKWQKKINSGYAETEEGAKEKKFYEPMLAHKYDDRKGELEFPLFCQPKLDGIRCIVERKNPQENITHKEDVVLTAKTRNGKPIESIPHILESLKGFFIANPNAILDGELYSHEYKDNFNKITSLVRKQKPVQPDGEWDSVFAEKEKEFQERLKESERAIQYWVYDAPKIGGFNESVKFGIRFDQIALSLNDRPHIVVVDTTEVNSFAQLDNAYSIYNEAGYEGQMVRKNHGYENKRSTSLLKRKEFQDAEYRVIDIDEGNGNRTGTAKHLVLWCDTKKTQFNSNIKGSFEYLAEILKNKDEYIGKKATIRFFQLTPDGIPRFPFAVGFRDYE